MMRQANTFSFPPAYVKYLQSPDWHYRRQKHLNVFRKCFCCNENRLSLLQVHHCSYAHLGSERQGEMITLCKHCHEKVHALIDTEQASLKDAHLLWQAQLRDYWAQMLLPFDDAA